MKKITITILVIGLLSSTTLISIGEEASFDYATIKPLVIVGTSNETHGIGYKTYLIARVSGHASRVNLNGHSLLGYADDLRIKPLGRRAVNIGEDQEGSNCFYSSRFFGTVKDGFVSGIAFSLRVGDWYYKPKSYDELVDWYKALESFYPGYIEVFKANELYNTGKVPGDGSKEYDLYYVRITNESLGLHKPEVLFLGAAHGEETVGTIGLYWFTDWLMRMAFTDEVCNDYSKEWLRWLVDNREIYLEVSHNPWGFDTVGREDKNGIELTSEYDYNGPANGPVSFVPEIWATVNSRTLREFVNHHQIRVGCEFHDGTRAIFYPWVSARQNITCESPVNNISYRRCPPDFYFFDVSSHRLCDYIHDYDWVPRWQPYVIKFALYYGWNKVTSGEMWYIGPTAHLINDAVINKYPKTGAMRDWAYGSDVVQNPSQDPYVNDEEFGNYPGSGILWISPEMATAGTQPPLFFFGNDTIKRYGVEVREFVLHQTDLAQPYVRWQPGTIQNNSVVDCGDEIVLRWQVNGSLVVDHTYAQWGTDPDPINNPQYTTSDYDEHDGDYWGGTGWDNADNGSTDGVTYSQTIEVPSPGDYYFVAKAQVDQIYSNVIGSEIYGDNSFLRIVKERTNSSYHEVIEGSDGTEEIFGQTWWYSPIIHVEIQ